MGSADMSKPVLPIGTPIRVVVDIPAWLLRARDLGMIVIDMGVNTFQVSLHTCQMLQAPGSTHLYGIQFSTPTGLRRYILCEEEIEPVD